MLLELINIVGNYGPILLIIVALWILYFIEGNRTYTYYFIVGIIINTILNLILKGAIQQPRPDDMAHPGAFQKRVRNILSTRHGLPFNLFGMPSGHAQAVMYVLTFLWAAVWRWKNSGWLLKGVLLLIGVIVMAQRVEWGHHTIFQVVVGTIVGCIIGLWAYWMGGGKLQSGGKGGLSKRPDDGAIWSYRVQAGFL